MNKEDAFINTHTGISFHPFKPNPSEIDLLDIAHALSNICRWNGHCNYHYSVAQHSIMVCLELKARGYSTRVQMIGLLHDASEAYICDIPKPLKPFMEGYEKIEEALQNTIYMKLAGYTPSSREWKVVSGVDEDSLWAEALELKDNKDFVPRIPKMHTEVCKRDPKAVRNDFIELYEQLREALNE
jgi:5'-deoxynucleotidase YfbR-like HD superfamily hydrolase